MQRKGLEPTAATSSILVSLRLCGAGLERATSLWIDSRRSCLSPFTRLSPIWSPCDRR